MSTAHSCDEARLREFFAAYERGANTFETELVASAYAEQFAGADPNGAACLRNDDEFRQTIPQRKAFFARLGFRDARILAIDFSALDERYVMARVHWRMVFEKQPGRPQTFEFDISYFVHDDGRAAPKIVFYISHEDEQKTMREAGLIDEQGRP